MICQVARAGVVGATRVNVMEPLSCIASQVTAFLTLCAKS